MARTTIIMVAAFLLLAGGVWALETTNPRAPAEKTVYVLEVKDTDVQRIDVTTEAGSAAFERAEPFGWRFAASDEQADLSRVSSVINRLAKLRSSAKVTDTVTDLPRYGLERPRANAVLTMKDGTTQRINLGNKTVNDAAYYAMVDGTTVLHTINTLIVGDVEKLVSEPPRPTPTVDSSASPSPRTTPSPVGTPTSSAAATEPAEAPTPTVGLPVIRTE